MKCGNKEKSLFELHAILRISGPLSAAYLAEFAMFATTKIVVGKLGYHSLAAVGIAGDLTFEVLVVLTETGKDIIKSRQMVV